MHGTAVLYFGLRALYRFTILLGANSRLGVIKRKPYPQGMVDRYQNIKLLYGGENWSKNLTKINSVACIWQSVRVGVVEYLRDDF